MVVFLILYVEDILLIGNDVATLSSVKVWLLLRARAWTPTMPPNRPEQVRIWFGHLTEHLMNALFSVNPLIRIGIRQVREHRAVTPVATVPSAR